jgi:hypothetical protein
VEAKSFSFSALADKPELSLVERRKGFVGSLSLSLQCSDWLADMVEAASLSLGEEDFAKTFREKGKVLKIHKGWNKSGRFLVATVFAEGGRRGGIWFPEGREGWGWRRIVGELRKCLGFLAAEERPLVSSVNAGGGSIRERSFAAVLSGLKSQSEFHFDLCPVTSRNVLAKGGEVTRSPVNCFELENGVPLKKTDSGTGRDGGGNPSGGGSGLRGGGSSRLKMTRVSRAWKALLVKIRLVVDRVLSRLGLRPKSPGFRLRVGRRFSGPRLGSRPKIVDATLEPFLGHSSGVGGQIDPQELAGLGPGSALGSGCSPSAMMESISPANGFSSPVTSEAVAVTSDAVAVTYSDVGLPVVATAEVSSTSLDVDATLAIIPSIPVRAETVAMDSGSPVVSVAMDSGSPEVSVASGLPTVTVGSNSLPLEPLSALAMLPELSLKPRLVSDVGLESLDVGVLGELSGPSPDALAMVACVDPIPLRRWSDTQARLGATLLSDPRLASDPVILEAFSLPWEDDLEASPGSSDWEESESGVADSVNLPVPDVSLAKVVRGSSPAKSLIRRGFLGPRAAPTPTVSDDAALLSARDKRERKAKGTRELKNLDCSMSPVKSQRRRGAGGSKKDISFPPKVH